MLGKNYMRFRTYSTFWGVKDVGTFFLLTGTIPENFEAISDNLKQFYHKNCNKKIQTFQQTKKYSKFEEGAANSYLG